MDCSKLTYTLHNGTRFPLIGFGTFQINGKKEMTEALDLALEAGYRSFDTATVYRNEEDIGAALKELLPKHNLSREDIFITSKLPPSHHGDRAPTALIDSLERLNCGYLDLYLIHWPGLQSRSPKDPGNAPARSKSWKYLVEAYDEGFVRNIGVSNYTVDHLEELAKNNFGIKPAVNQVEWHPYCHQPELLEYCRKEGILLQAYSSLGGSDCSSLREDATVQSIGARIERDPAQVLLRWALQQEIAIIPKARSRKHIEDNMDLNFVIPASDMQALSCLRQSKFAWDPSIVL